MGFVRIARYTEGDDPVYGLVDADGKKIAEVSGDPFYQRIELTGKVTTVDEVRLLAPTIPRSKVIGIGRNYADHAAEMGHEVPAEPLVFLKPNTSVIGPDDPIVLPPWSREVHHEAELAVVISRLCKYVPAAKVQDVIFGYTVANDVTARDVQATDAQWTRAKGFDTSCPLGPYLAVDLDVSDLAVRARVDGVVRQDGRTSDLVHKVPELIEYVSSIFTLLPGDVILTGTPAGVGPIEVGQRVEVEVEGIGSFSNPVVRRD